MKNQKIKYSIIVILLIVSASCFFMSSCSNEDNDGFTDSAILESYLQEGSPFILKISRQIPFNENANFSSDDINNLSITVNNGTSSHLLTPVGDGAYTDSNPVLTGVTYTISFTYNNKNVSASTSIPSIPTGFNQSVTQMLIPQQPGGHGPPVGNIPDPLILSWDNTDSSYYFMVVQNLETTPVPITLGDHQQPKPFLTQPTNLNTTAIRAMDFTYYGQHRIILYHVYPDYASLYANVNNSSQNLTNPSSNIINGYGIFTGISSDTLYVDIQQP